MKICVWPDGTMCALEDAEGVKNAKKCTCEDCMAYIKEYKERIKK